MNSTTSVALPHAVEPAGSSQLGAGAGGSGVGGTDAGGSGGGGNGAGGGGMGSGGQSPTYADLVLDDGPMAYFRFEDPVGATTAVDLTGTFTATLVGASPKPPPTLGQPGLLANDPDKSLLMEFGQIVRMKINGDENAAFPFEGKAPFSIEMWVKPIVVHDGRFFGKWSSVTPGNGYLLDADTGLVGTETRDTLPWRRNVAARMATLPLEWQRCRSNGNVAILTHAAASRGAHPREEHEGHGGAAEARAPAALEPSLTRLHGVARA